MGWKKYDLQSIILPYYLSDSCTYFSNPNWCVNRISIGHLFHQSQIIKESSWVKNTEHFTWRFSCSNSLWISTNIENLRWSIYSTFLGRPIINFPCISFTFRIWTHKRNDSNNLFNIDVFCRIFLLIMANEHILKFEIQFHPEDHFGSQII